MKRTILLTVRVLLVMFVLAVIEGGPAGIVPARAYDLPPSLNLGLTSFLDQRCATLSTGQKQRVNLARALIHDPQIMLLDEPTRGLDVWGSDT